MQGSCTAPAVPGVVRAMHRCTSMTLLLLAAALVVPKLQAGMVLEHRVQ